MVMVWVEYTLVCARRRVYAHALGVCAAVAGRVRAVTRAEGGARGRVDGSCAVRLWRRWIGTM